MNANIADDSEDADTKSSSDFQSDGLTNGGNGVEESNILMDMLTSLDVHFAFSAEKLVNLDVYMTLVSLGDSVGELLMQNSDLSEIEIEKALAFDLSLGYLDSEVAELGHLLNALRTKIIDAHQRLHSFRLDKRAFTACQEKLRVSKSSWKHLQEQLSGLENQVSSMTGTFFGKKSTFSSEDAIFEIPGSGLQTAGKQRLVLRMLDKSLCRELDLEKQLLRSREREEELESKLVITDTVVSNLESFSEFALERLLQAEHSSIIFMGIAKEMMTRLQVLHFNMHCLVQREEQLKAKLQNALEQLKENKTSLMEIEDIRERLTRSSQDKIKLEEKVKVLEEKLQSAEFKLRQVNVSYDISQAQLSLMESTVETLEGDAYMAETRAHVAEETFAALTEENMELREEVTFLKSGDSNVEKISLLENEVRDLEVQLKTAKSTSEANLEQQNMLYKAIFDMEMLIEELRSKVSTAENRVDNAQQECLTLAETNLALNKEITYLKSNSYKLEGSLKEANKTKVAWVKHINSGAGLITEMVMQLASERERIQKQIYSLARENKILLEELRRMRKICPTANQDDKEVDGKYSVAVMDNPNPGISLAVSAAEEVVKASPSLTASNQVDKPDNAHIRHEAEATSYSASDAAAATEFTNDETEAKAVSRHFDKKYYSFAALVLLLSILAMNISTGDR